MKLEFITLIQMIRELDIEKNTKKDIREVLNYIANDLEKFEKYIGGNNGRQ